MRHDWLDDIKTKFKQNPALYRLLIEYISPVKVNKAKTYHMLFDHVPDKEGVIINLGSGPFRLQKNIVNVDITAYTEVDVIADITKLPFKDSSVDGVINLAVLEHVSNPDVVIREVLRILKPGGIIYTVIPFMQGFHASPYDYQRYTSEGIKTLHRDFLCISTGVDAGPTSGFLWVLEEWLAVLFSLGSTRLYKVWFFFFMAVLWPLKFLDVLLVNNPMAQNIASAFYYLGKKGHSGVKD